MSSGPYAIGSDTWPGAAKVLEEAGELSQVLGKLIAIAGGTAHWDGTDLRERMADEVADLEAALEFFVAHNDIPAEYVNARRLRKIAQFEAWHEEHKEIPDVEA